MTLLRGNVRHGFHLSGSLLSFIIHHSPEYYVHGQGGDKAIMSLDTQRPDLTPYIQHWVFLVWSNFCLWHTQVIIRKQCVMRDYITWHCLHCVSVLQQDTCLDTCKMCSSCSSWRSVASLFPVHSRERDLLFCLLNGKMSSLSSVVHEALSGGLPFLWAFFMGGGGGCKPHGSWVHWGFGKLHFGRKVNLC